MHGSWQLARSLHEAGLPGYETLAWNGLLAPKGTPPAIRERLRAALLALKGDPALAGRIRLLGGEYVVSTPEDFAARIRAALRDAGVDDRLTTAVLETMDAAAERVPDPAAVDLAATVLGLTPGR